MKSIFLLILVFSCSFCKGQTRDVDYDFMKNNSLITATSSTYKTENLLSSSSPKGNNTITYLNFVSYISAQDNKKRGIAIVYKEIKNNSEMPVFKVFCLPERGSDDNIMKKCFSDIEKINSPYISTFITWGLMKLVTKIN
jgi:hypothetical protein